MHGRTLERISPSLLEKRLLVTAVWNAVHIRSNFAPWKDMKLYVLSQKLPIVTGLMRRELNFAFRSAFAEDRRVLHQLLSFQL